MPAEWFEAFDDEPVRDRTLRASRVWIVGFALASGVLVAAAPLTAVAWPEGSGWVAFGCGLALVALGLVVVARVGRLHRTIWRIDVSVRQIVAHDVAGRRHTLAWSAIERVDVDGTGLTVVGREASGARIRWRIGATCPSYPRMAHRVVEYVEAFGRPVWVEGQPWESLSLTDLYPLVRARRAV